MGKPMTVARGRLILHNFLSLMMGEAGYMLLRFAAIIYLARVLVVEGFGRLNFVVALVTSFMLLVNVGLNELGVREVSRRHELVGKYVGTITSFRTALAVVAFGLLAASCRWIGLSQTDTALALLAGGMLFTYAWSVEWAFRGLEQMGVVGQARALNSLVYLVAVVAVVRGVNDLLLVGACLVGGELIAVAYLYFHYWRRVGAVRLHVRLGDWAALLRQSWPIGLAFAMSTTFFQVDFILLGLMKGETAVGLYSAAGRLVSIFYTISIICVSAIFPQIAQRAKEAPGELGRFLAQVSRAVLMAVLPAGLLATLLARPIIGSLYGPSYLGSVLAFQVLVWSLVVYFIGHLLSYSLVGQDRQNAYLGVLTLGAVINVTLNLLFIGPFGIVGAASAKLASQIVVLIVAYALLRRSLGFSLTKEVVRTTAAAVVMGAGMLVGLSWPLPAVVPLAVVLYLGTLILVQGVTSADMRMLQEIVFPR